MPILSDKSCERRWEGTTEWHFCADYLEGQKDICEGDSGGPLQCPRSDGRMVLMGVVSFGGKCGKKGDLSAFIRVEDHLEWIQKKKASGKFV